MELFKSLVVALAIGLLIGLQRSWQEKSKKKGGAIAGLRTFGLIGLLGGLWAYISQVMGEFLMAVSFLAFAALIILSFLRDYRKERDYGVTTMVASFVTFALGAIAVIGQPQVAAAFAVVTGTLLGMKSIFHAWVASIEKEEILSVYKLLIISVVLLPILPNQGYGPGGVLNPYEIWWLVVLIAGISFIGYFAVKIKGTRIGLLLTSFFGGLASSTAVTITFSKLALQNIHLHSLLSAGVLVASATMFPRILLEVAVVNIQLGSFLIVPLLVMMLISYAGAFLFWKKKGKEEPNEAIVLKNPFEIIPAVKFGILLTVIIVLAKFLQMEFGNIGVYLLAFFSGVSDVDAITLTMARMSREGELSLEVASRAIIIAAFVNTMVKAVLVAFIARGKMVLEVFIVMFVTICVGLGVVFLF